MQRNIIIILLIFLFPLSGCTPGINVKKAPPGSSVVSSGEDKLISGRIRWIHNGEEVKRFSKMNSLTTGFQIAFRILRAEDMKTGTIFEVEEDGSFFVLLPKGTYVIHRLDWADFWGGGHLVPRVAFQVSDKQQSYYLGTLVVNVKTKRNIFGDQIVKGLDVYIEDEEIETMKVFHSRYPHQDVKVAKALMIHDSSIPRIDELENQRILLDLIRSLSFGLQIILQNP